MKRALNYNEQKVQKGQANLIHAGNFLQKPEELNFHQKLERFEKLMALNDRAQTKVLHVSLNFHPSEKERLTPEFLQELSQEYMLKLGFGNQPYLVYQHHDAGHPHVHIVSTLIRDDGTRVNTHKLGKDVSEPIRKEMEETYGLVKADKKEYDKQQEQHRVVDVQKVQYGKSETKRSITNVLDAVINQYKYTSMAELNAVLKQYNVMADRGHEEGRIYKTRGLTYRILDESGQKTGVPIKASAIYSKPTLDKLEKKFTENEKKREPDKKHLKNTIEWAMHKNPRSMDELVKMLANERVTVMIRRNEQGRIYGLTYIDHETKAVFNGSDLGKDYSAKRMLERLGMEQQPQQEAQKEKNLLQSKPPQNEPKNIQPLKEKETTRDESKNEQNQPSFADALGKGLSKMLDQLMQPGKEDESLNSELKKDEEKRRRRRNQEREL